MPFLFLIDVQNFLYVFVFEISQVIRKNVHVHCDNKRPIEMRIAKEFQTMSVRVSREFEALTFQQKDMQT